MERSLLLHFPPGLLVCLYIIFDDSHKLLFSGPELYLFPKKSLVLQCTTPTKRGEKVEPETPRYRDCAKELPEDQNPDYEPTELGSFHAVALPGTDLRLADAHKISIEKKANILEVGYVMLMLYILKDLSKAWTILHKVQSEIKKKPDAEDGKDSNQGTCQLPPQYSFRHVSSQYLIVFPNHNRGFEKLLYAVCNSNAVMCPDSDCPLHNIHLYRKQDGTKTVP